MEENRIYYDKKTGFVCGRYPKDLPIDEGTPYIEATEEEVDKTYSCPFGQAWAVKNGSLALVEDTDVTSSDEYKKFIKGNEIASLKAYLSETDYVISKLNELKLEDEDGYEEAKTQYSDVLRKRKEARARINELEG